MAASSLLPNDGRPLHVRIKEWLLHQIQTYDLDAQLPSDRELARNLGASYLTVNKVMVELEREGYVVRRPGRGTFLASRERRVSNEVAIGRKGEIIFAYPNHFSYGFWTRVRNAEELALKKGLGFVEFKMNRDTTYKRLIDMVSNHENVRGLFVQPTPASVTQDIADQLNELGIPVVICGACDWATQPENLYQTSPDAFKEGYTKITYLAERGHTSIGYVHNEPDSPESAQEWRGMRQALRDCGIALKDLKRNESVTQSWQDSLVAGWSMTKELMSSNKVTALAVDSQAGAVGAIHALWDLGLRVPDDVSVIATGDGWSLAEHTTPPLTVVLSDPAAEISAGFDIILGVSRPGNHAMFIEAQLVERESVADLRTAAAKAESSKQT